MDPDPPLPDITKPIGNATAGALFGIAGGGVSDPNLPEQAGERIGPYKLREQIGEGGFGSVWVADQEAPIQRRVALKIIKLGMDTKDVVARFEQERQALALMDHPNIAKVLDAGATQWGRPFFVMELVRGIKITDYCDQANVPTVERLKLFAQVCHAVQHAHQKGIIHRDLKPSNILVTLHDGAPVPKVIDFGIAKATHGRLTDKTIYTQFKHMIGTPLYMSPEQTELSGLDVDTRSDIYSLGVLLYELLVGRTPFDADTLMKAGLDEMRRVIREQEPPKPSTALQTMPAELRTTVAARRQADAAKMTRLLRGDLDWIVMKALEKDRTRRYETANGFAEDIRRYLSNEPVSAGPPSIAYRFGKFARRNRLALAAGGVVALTLVAGIAVSTWQAIRATRAEQRATERAAAESKARKDADAMVALLITIFRSPDPARNGRTITVAEVLDAAVKNVDARLATQPDIRARLLNILGQTYHTLGLVREAIPLYEKVRDHSLVASGQGHPDTFRAMHNLALAYQIAGRRAEALKLIEEVLAFYRKQFGVEHPDTLTVMGALASSYSDAGRHDEALKLREEVLTLRRKMLGPEHPDTLSAMHNLANSYPDAGRREEALEMREEALALSRKVHGTEHRTTLTVMSSLADSYSHAGRREEALKRYEEALALSRKLLGPEHPDTLTVMHNLAIFYNDANRQDEALSMQEEVLALRRKALGPEHPDTVTAMHDLADLYSHAGRREEALKMQEETLALSRKALGPEHRTTLAAMSSLAKSYSHSDRRDEALKMQEEALALGRKALGPEHRITIAAMHSLADSYSDAGRREEALKMQEEALALSRKAHGPEHRTTLAVMSSLADSYSGADRREEALKLREEALALGRKLFGPEHHDTFSMMLNLAISYAASDRKEDALKMFEEVLTCRRKLLGPEHPDTLNAMLNLASFHAQNGHQEEALKMREEVAALSRKVLGPEHPDTLAAMHSAASSYSEAGRWDEAIKLQEEVLLLRRKKLGTEHPDTLSAMMGMAISCAQAGRAEEALKIFEEVLALRQKKLGLEHPDTITTLMGVAELHHKTGHWGEALKAFENLLASLQKVDGPAHPATVATMNQIAWILATCPDAALRNPIRAVELATQTVKLDPKNSAGINTLGVAQYRTGDYAAAIATLEKSRGLNHGADAADGFFLAMARWKLGDKQQALRDYEQAVAWMKKNQPKDEYFLRFWDEAKALLNK